MTLTWCVVSIGGNLTFFFLATNYYLANQNTRKANFTIIEAGTHDPRYNLPYIKIEKDDLNKEIIFKPNLPKDITNYKSIDLTTSKGALGFDIIRNRHLVEKNCR